MEPVSAGRALPALRRVTPLAKTWVPRGGSSTALETERLHLVPIQPGDLNDLALMHADPAVMRGSSGSARPRTRTESSAWLGHALSSVGMPWQRTFRVEDRGDHSFVGRCGLRPVVATSETEIAYAFVRDAWGRGFATEAARAVIEWGARMGLTRLTARALDDNVASQHVLEKIGMRSIGHQTTPEGDVVLYELDAS